VAPVSWYRIVAMVDEPAIASTSKACLDNVIRNQRKFSISIRSEPERSKSKFMMAWRLKLAPIIFRFCITRQDPASTGVEYIST
jgi:hypothetical protein